MSMDEIVTHYYFRFAALDRPGVLSKISGVLGNHDISIQSVQQKGRKTDGSVPGRYGESSGQGGECSKSISGYQQSGCGKRCAGPDSD